MNTNSNGNRTSLSVAFPQAAASSTANTSVPLWFSDRRTPLRPRRDQDRIFQPLAARWWRYSPAGVVGGWEEAAQVALWASGVAGIVAAFWG